MALAVERSCSMIVSLDSPASASDIKSALEGNDNELKAEMLKKAIAMGLAGEQIPGLLICVIRYVLPSEDHTVQRLLLLYLETIERTDQSGKMLQEMILICQNLRNNLQHPNEYIRGVTLRFLCRIHEEDILEPLVPSITENLEHRHSFVRRNAVMCLNELYKLPRGDQLFQDAPGLIATFLGNEQDLSAKRNAFMFLSNHDPDRAVAYLSANLDKLIDWGAILQMAVLDLIRKVCRTKPQDKSKYVKIIFALLSSTKPAVVYDCATTLTALSQAPTAIRAAANCFCQLLVTHSDNNVKLIVLDRLGELKAAHADILAELLMDVMRALSTPAFDIRRKILDLAMDLITPKNINEVVAVLKKELMRTQGGELERSGEYRQVLVQCVHKCAVKYPDVASAVVHILMEFLGDNSTVGALDVAFFVREMIQSYPKMHASLLEQLRDTFTQLQSARVCTTVLWILAEYSREVSDVTAAIDTILGSLGPTPFSKDAGDAGGENGKASEAPAGASPAAVKVRPQVLADGTYATQVAEASPAPAAAVAGDPLGAQNLRALFVAGDTFLGAVTAVTLVKLLLRLKAAAAATGAPDVTDVRRRSAETMLALVAMLRFDEARAAGSTLALDRDSRDRIATCFRMLTEPSKDVVQLWLEAYRASYAEMLEERRSRDIEEQDAKAAANACQPDDLIDFAHLKHRKGVAQIELEDEVATDLQRATGLAGDGAAAAGALTRTMQLTGLSDAVYAEAQVITHQYDVVLDVTVINRTAATMQSLCLELATMGDLKLVERPQNYTLAAGETKRLRANIKVSSTETGVIFGNIVYEQGGTGESHVVVLNDIHIDIMDYIAPAPCADVAFRNFWAEFEWENKVAVNTDITEPKAFLEHVVKQTNMKCLNPPSSLAGDCGYLSANLYAKSVFGEDALVNLSVEQSGGRLVGFLRIRAKSQGIALSLGDKITLKQKAAQ